MKTKLTLLILALFLLNGVFASLVYEDGNIGIGNEKVYKFQYPVKVDMSPSDPIGSLDDFFLEGYYE